MAELRGGAGGYGGITSMNTDQREGPYGYHAVSSRVDYQQDVVFCHCIKCDLRWTHPRGERKAPYKDCRPESSDLCDMDTCENFICELNDHGR